MADCEEALSTMKTPWLIVLFGLWSPACAGIPTIAAVPDAAPDAVGFESLRFESQVDGGFVLRGPDARHQLVVSGIDGGGQVQDLTQVVTYRLDPAGVVQVDSTGLATPLANGQASVTATVAGGPVVTATICVERLDDAPPVNFANQVVPLFTKYACNSGGCHGKSGGQNGFRLSLLGFEPQEDYEYLVKEGRGRRLFPAAPDHSLLLLKLTNAVPHGGGQRIKRGTHDYRTLRRWIVQGMPYGSESDPKVTRIQVLPGHRTMGSAAVQQMGVWAHFDDGSIEDVTHTAHYDTNDKRMATVDEGGRVRVTGEPGDVAIMVRYQEHASVFRATVPLGAPVDSLPAPRNFIDTLVGAKLKLLGMPPSPVCDDATFVRRVTLDIAGRLPTPDEAERFLTDPDPAKRDRWIDQLLAGTDHADFFANKWSAILRNTSNDPQTYAFYHWIRQSLYENKPYDQFVRQIVAASGDVTRHAPVAWYRQVNEPKKQMEDVAQLFLGVRMQCAQCHHHPYEKWSQDDYYGFSAFFTKVARKAPDDNGDFRIYNRRGEATSENPKTKQVLMPTALGGPPLSLDAQADPRHALADWMVDPDNRFFGRSLVNRYWKHFFNRGLVEPEDDLRATNPPTNAEVLDALAEHFVASGFNLKALIRLICQSATYQLASMPNEYNGKDTQNFSRYYPRRLHAEVLLDAIDAVTGSKSEFKGLPAATRAVQLPDSSMGNYFLKLFGRPTGASVCECERTSEANLAQSLHLLNSAQIRQKLTGGRAGDLAAGDGGDDKKIHQLYLLAYSRPPDAGEIETAMAHIRHMGPQQKQEAFEDVIWAIINTKEFMFNH